VHAYSSGEIIMNKVNFFNEDRTIPVTHGYMKYISEHSMHDVRLSFYGISEKRGVRHGLGIECKTCGEVLVDICEEYPHGN
jgi:hypothetical protein